MDGLEVVGLHQDEHDVLAEGAPDPVDGDAFHVRVVERPRATAPVGTVGGRVGLLDVEKHGHSMGIALPGGKQVSSGEGPLDGPQYSPGVTGGDRVRDYPKDSPSD